jgi:hypothetical protein
METLLVLGLGYSVGFLVWLWLAGKPYRELLKKQRDE